jgi:nucleotide-binding universal stress UspA family protein
LTGQYAKDLQDKVIHVRGIAMRGDPREEIVEKVEEVKADVLVIGSRGMGALSRLLVGSINDHWYVCIY